MSPTDRLRIHGPIQPQDADRTGLLAWVWKGVGEAAVISIDQIVRHMPKGAARACLSMTEEWQFAGKATFNSNGAWSLHHLNGVGGRGALAECEARKDGKWSRYAYRLTPLGATVQAARRGMTTTHNEGRAE